MLPCNVSTDIMSAIQLRAPLTMPESTRFMLTFYKWSGVPSVMLRLIYLCMSNASIDLSPVINHLELFAGRQAVTNAFSDHNLLAVPFELENDPVMFDFMGTVGYANAICLVLKIVMGGSANTAPVCSSWTFMNSGTAHRSLAYPLGNQDVQSVAVANMMVSRITQKTKPQHLSISIGQCYLGLLNILGLGWCVRLLG